MSEDQIRAEFEAKFPMPEQAVYDNGDYVWTSHPTACHPYNQLYQVWCEARSTYRAEAPVNSIAVNSEKWRVDDTVVDSTGRLYVIDGVKGNRFLVREVDDITNAVSFLSADKLSWHSRVTRSQEKK